MRARNWRIDCGVAGYDSRLGLPPFFPTRLRFEDYIYRLWVQQAGLASAHVDAAQNLADAGGDLLSLQGQEAAASNSGKK